MNAQTFENGEWLEQVRLKLNGNAEEINRIGATLSEKVTIADAAAMNADQKAQLANDKAVLANTAAINADNKASLAQTAADNANDKANLADQKATAANTATATAIQATTDAITAKTNAIQATTDVITAKTNAETATANAIAAAATANGAKGWTPVFIDIADGSRIVRKLSDYIGGTGVKPSLNLNNYLKSDGTYTATISQAYDYSAKALQDMNVTTGVGVVNVWTGTVAEKAALGSLNNSWIYLVRRVMDIPLHSTPRFRYKVRHRFRSKVRQHSAGKVTSYSAAKYATLLRGPMLLLV